MKIFFRGSRMTLIALTCFLAGLESQAAGPETFKVSELTFKRPAKWEWVESRSSMRAAQLNVPGEKDQAAEVVFFYFGPGSGGGTQANVDRWLGQFAEPREKINAKVEERTVGGIKATYVQAEGTYNSGPPLGPKTPLPDHGMLAAIIEGKQGHVFVRMTGPKGLVNGAGGDFKGMVEGALK
jgi:hypothetical protein